MVHMTSEENKVVVRRFEEAMNTRQLDVLDELIAPNFVRHCQATPQLDIRSLEQFKEFLRQDVATFPDNTQTFTHLVAEGDMAAVWATYEGTQMGQMGQMGPFPPSGKKVTFDFGAVLRVENGMLAELWITWDNMTILGQLGHLSAAPNVNG
jgi:predicted ester cyclase